MNQTTQAPKILVCGDFNSTTAISLKQSNFNVQITEDHQMKENLFKSSNNWKMENHLVTFQPLSSNMRLDVLNS